MIGGTTNVVTHGRSILSRNWIESLGNHNQVNLFYVQCSGIISIALGIILLNHNNVRRKKVEEKIRVK